MTPAAPAKGAAKDKGEDDYLVDVDPHQARNLFIFGDRAHGFTHLGMFDQPIKTEHQDQVQHKDHNLYSGNARSGRSVRCPAACPRWDMT